MINEKAYLYQETEEYSGLFFIKEGSLAFVLPRYDNAIYKKVSGGDIIGFEDYVYYLSINFVRFEKTNTTETEEHMRHVERKFTVISTSKCHALELPMNEV